MFRSCAKSLRSMLHVHSKMEFNRSQGTFSKPTLYGDEASPPVRFVMMTASVLGIEVEFHNIDLFSGENKSEFYTSLNPLQKVPVLSVGNEIIKDSHAIALYFCNKASTELYPEDALNQAKVNQMLFFNSSSLFPIDSEIFTSYFAGRWPVSDSIIESWNYLLDFLEGVLNETKWLAGEKMTISDLCCAATITSLRLLVPPLDRHIRVNQWLRNLNTHQCFAINARGLERLNKLVKNMK